RDLAEDVLVAGLGEVRGNHLGRIGLGLVRGKAHLLGRPQAQQLVAPGFRLEAQFGIVRELGFLALLAIVKTRHLGPLRAWLSVAQSRACPANDIGWTARKFNVIRGPATPLMRSRARN